VAKRRGRWVGPWRPPLFVLLTIQMVPRFVNGSERSFMTKRESDGVIFGRHLRELRLARNLTQQQLAAMIDSNHPFISNMERGLALPGLAMLTRLAYALECNVSELVKILDVSPRATKVRKV